MDDDVEDVLLAESFEDAPTLPAPTTPLLGIGGKDGMVFDVNKLKRNLVQETVQQYKRELWTMLGTPSASLDLVQDKLAALLQANPISTTTDSNLLDGGEWSFAVKSKQPANVLLDSNRFLINRAPGTALLGVAEKAFSTNARQYYLEEFKDHDSPFVLDQTTYLGGVLSRKRTYNVVALTRTKMDLDISKVQWTLCGTLFISKSCTPQKSRKVQVVQILYIDSDLLISCDQGLDRPYSVYTKSPEWTARAQRVKRKLRLVGSVLAKIRTHTVGVMTFRQRMIQKAQNRIFGKRQVQVKEQNLILSEIKGEGKSSLKVLKLGDFAGNDAWEGEEDPFVNLSADERQKKLKSMKVRDIQLAGQEQQRKAEKEKKRVIYERKRVFKKPESK